MKPKAKRTVSNLSALLMAGALAGTTGRAQEISTSLPLTSVGDELMWAVGDQTLNLTVPVTGSVKLELYSPRVDPQDYRSDTYFGDETYAKDQGGTESAEPVATTFTLIDAEGKEVLSRTFTPGQHEWETFSDQELPAGTYRLRAQTAGNGKNTFALRLTGVSAVISAEQLSVNVRSSDWVPALGVSTDGSGYSLRMYDGDGPGELEARLRDAEGNVSPLSVSGDLAWSDLALPEKPGQYVVELRQPQSAQQYSNTVSFGLQHDGSSSPITVARVDQTGQLRLSAELLLPTGAVPTQVTASVDGQAVQVSGTHQQTVAAGTHAVQAQPVTGATVQTDRSEVTVAKGETAEVRVSVRPQVNLELRAERPQVCVGEDVVLVAGASTAYPGELPLDLQLDTPGLTLDGAARQEGQLSAAQPAELRVTGKATQAGPLKVTARLAPWGLEQQVEVQVLPAATQLRLSRAPLADAQIGDEVVVRLSVTNAADQAMPFTLTDQPADGLKALEATRFEGTLEPGETRELSYRAEVLAAGVSEWQAQLDSPACPAPQQVGTRLNVTAPVQEAPQGEAPAVVRESTISLPFDVPRETEQVIIGQALPAGATFVPGSTRLDGQPVADPVRGTSGKFYWVLPAPTGNGTERGAAIRGVLSYDLTHTDSLGAVPAASLQVQLSGNRTETLQGQFDDKDLLSATALQATTVQEENEGAIKLPASGTVFRIRDRISVTVEAPQGVIPPLTVNGVAVSDDTIGTNTQDGVRNVQRLTYVGVPIKAGANVLRFLDQEITVYLVGATEKVELKPLALTADGSSPLRVQVRALDAAGKLTSQPTVTVRTNLEPRLPDADPSEAGYQVKLTDGQGVLELQPQASPVTLTVDVVRGESLQAYKYEVVPDRSRVGVGVVSATVGLDGSFQAKEDLSWQARGSFEGPVGSGKLYVSADKDGLPTDRNTLVRHPVYGDASVESVPLQGIDPVAFSYDHPNFRVAYRRSSLPIDVLPVGEELTALTAYSKTNPQVSAFVALVPEDRVVNRPLTPEGTRILHLPDTGITLGSETLELVTVERDSGKELLREKLVRNVDYVLDPRSGVVTFNRAIDRLDAQLNERLVYASYRLDNPLGKRRAVYGAQVKTVGKNYMAGIAAVQIDGQTTFGAKATYEQGNFRANALLAYSGGVQASAEVSTVLATNHDLNFRVRYQQESYAGLAPFTPGLVVSGKYTGRLSQRLNVVADAEYRDLPTPRQSDVENAGHTRGGNVTARAVYQLRPFTVGAGVSYAFGDQHGLGLVGSVGYQQGPVSVDVVHTQPVSGNLRPSTDITSRFKVRENLTLGFTDKVTWGVGQAAALTLDTKAGNVNYAVGYELPTASGAGNRARFGATTTLPLNRNTALNLRGNTLYDVGKKALEVGTGADINYKSDRISATAGTDVSYGSEKGFGVVLRAGVTGSVSDELTLNAGGMAELGQGRKGQRLEMGYAYRGRQFSSLGYGRYVNGSLAGGQPELSFGVSAEYRQPTWAVRGGVESRTKLDDRDSFTLQGSLGVTSYLSDRFAVGAWGRALTQPASQTTMYGYGVEGSVRALPGTWLTAGYNFKGFDGLENPATYTRQGAYVRLDLTLDEAVGQRK
ncbi:DUF11 domain-containing protein [Deinococcus sp. VB142]|uniref:DUF11 domain-containing protein n=2 Tax=Deinococcus sp. VB142 TaxID=3112952 RepID=A0AAU6Q041_9DEIO